MGTWYLQDKLADHGCNYRLVPDANNAKCEQITAKCQKSKTEINLHSYDTCENKLYEVYNIYLQKGDN